MNDTVKIEGLKELLKKICEKLFEDATFEINKVRNLVSDLDEFKDKTEEWQGMIDQITKDLIRIDVLDKESEIPILSFTRTYTDLIDQVILEEEAIKKEDYEKWTDWLKDLKIFQRSLIDNMRETGKPNRR